jgi:hypothetical protein
MIMRFARGEQAFVGPGSAPALLLFLGFVGFAPLSRGQVNLGPITVGAGLQTSFASTGTDGGGTINQFLLNSARLYISGPVTENIKFMFNTEYDGANIRVSQSQLLGRPFSTAKRPRESLWPVLFE